MTYRTFVTRIAATPVARAYWGSRLFGTAIGLMADLLMEGCAQAVRNLWFRRDDAPDDGVLLKGAETRLPIYAAETVAAYRARIGDRWNLLETVAVESGINAQITAAGLTGTVMFQPGYPGPNFEDDYWSQFWILTTLLDAPSLELMVAIAKKWKPVQWIFRGFVANDAIAMTVPDLIPVGDTVAEGVAPLG